MTVSELISVLQKLPPNSEAVRLDIGASEQPAIGRLDAIDVFVRRAEMLDLKGMAAWQLDETVRYEVVVGGL